MSDLIKPDGGLTVEERLALLEARLAGPAPQAVVPPITIGSLTNVPVPGGQIAAQWAQDVTGIALHRFASKASLDGWAAPVGARAITTNDNLEWRRVAGAWSRVTPWRAAIGGTGTGGVGGPISTRDLARITVPADPGPRTVQASCYVQVNKYTPGPMVTIRLYVNGNIAARQDIAPWNIDVQGQGLTIPYYVAMSVNEPGVAAAFDVVSTVVSNATSGSEAMIPTDATLNRLDVLVVPI